MKHPARHAILGYITRGPVGRKEWIVDPEKGLKVKQVLEQFSTGKYTIEEITRYAYDIGLRSTDNKTIKGVISTNTWINRLKDIKYTGIFYQEDERHEDERIVGDYEPLISTETFYQIQEVFEKKKHPKSVHMDYAYSGLIKCSRCGDKLSGTHKKGITYYRCGKKKSPCKEINRVPYMPEKDIENDLMIVFESVEINQETWKTAREYVVELNKPQKAEINKQIRMLSEHVSTEERMQIDLGRKFTQGDLVKSDYDRLMEDSHARIASLRNSIIKCENIVQEITELMYEFLDNIKHITSRLRLASALNKRELVEIFCENLVWDYKKLHWDWLKPFHILLNQPKNSSMLQTSPSILYRMFPSDLVARFKVQLDELKKIIENPTNLTIVEASNGKFCRLAV